MLNFFNQLKAFNRQRVTTRRNAKFQNVFSNEFDRAGLQLEALKPLLANTFTHHNKINGRKDFAVYSTFFGDSNARTFNKTDINQESDHFFISNNKQILNMATDRGWHPIYLDLPISINRVLSAQQSKIPKALPHLFPALKNYDSLLYIDDKVSFNATQMYQQSQILIQKNQALMIREHPSLKDNILNELSAAMIQPRYQSQREQAVAYITDQIKQGRSLNVKNLYWTSAILRNMTHPDTIRIGENWYEAILSCGIECQISFDFVAQNYKSILLMPQNIT
jgi:hypothetical protein